jgi:hypothetical protein
MDSMTKSEEDLLVRYFTNQLTTFEEYQALDDLCKGDPAESARLYGEIRAERRLEILKHFEIDEAEIARKVAEKFREAAYNESCPDCRHRMLESIGEKPGNA